MAKHADEVEVVENEEVEAEPVLTPGGNWPVSGLYVTEADGTVRPATSLETADYRKAKSLL